MRLTPKGSFFTFNITKIPWKWFLAVILVVLLVYGNVVIYEQLTRLPPDEAVKQGLTKTLSAQSYRYQAVAKRTLEGQEAIISDITGEKNMRGVHIKGTLPIIAADVEVYYFNDVMYRRDATSHGWLVVPDKSRAVMEQLIAEINPLGVFYFNEGFDVNYEGRQKVGNETCYVYEVMTRGQNKYLELYWEDFNYILWIDKKEGFIRKAQISAEQRDNSQYLLNMTVELSGFDESIEINPPEV